MELGEGERFLPVVPSFIRYGAPFFILISRHLQQGWSEGNSPEFLPGANRVQASRADMRWAGQVPVPRSALFTVHGEWSRCPDAVPVIPAGCYVFHCGRVGSNSGPAVIPSRDGCLPSYFRDAVAAAWPGSERGRYRTGNVNTTTALLTCPPFVISSTLA
jgi:hypothetical protein